MAKRVSRVNKNIYNSGDKGMSYWVYENISNNHARIHLGSCNYCKEGKGTHNHPETSLTSRWCGPYNSYSAAEQKAKETDRYYKDCKLCLS